MGGFLNTFAELCAGQGTVKRVSQHSFEKRYAASIVSSKSSSLAADSSSAISSSESTCLGPAPKAATQSLPNGYLPGLRGHSAFPEQAHPPIFSRSSAFFKDTQPYGFRDQLQTIFPIEVDGTASGGRQPKKSQTLSQSRSPSDSIIREYALPPFVYEVPPPPEMVGIGRLRHAADATDEWLEERYRKDLDSHGIELPGISSTAKPA